MSCLPVRYLLCRATAAAEEAASALQQQLQQRQQEAAGLVAERDELRLECDNLTTAVSSKDRCSQSSTHVLPHSLRLLLCAMRCIEESVLRCCVGLSKIDSALEEHWMHS